LWYEVKDNFVIFNIKALPAASKNEILYIYDESLKVKIKAPAVDGAANREIVKFFSKKFKISKSEISFVSGEKSKRKRLRVPYNEKIEIFIKEKSKENENAGKSV